MYDCLEATSTICNHKSTCILCMLILQDTLGKYTYSKCKSEWRGVPLARNTIINQFKHCHEYSFRFEFVDLYEKFPHAGELSRPVLTFRKS